MDRDFGLALRRLARAVLPAKAREKALVVLVRRPVSHDRDQRLVLSHAVARGGERMARADAAGFPVRVEGIEVHHPLEAAERELREFDRTDGDATEGAFSEGRRGPVPASATVFQEPRTAGVVPWHAPALLSLRLRISPQELVRRGRLRAPARA